MNNIEKLCSIKHFALDMDGTIYKDTTLFDCTPGFLSKLDSLSIGYTLLTNNSSKSCADYLLKLAKMGLKIKKDQLYTSTLATIDYLRSDYSNVKKLFVLGTASLKGEFAEAGYSIVSGDEEPEAVVVGFDMELEYPKLCKAAYWIKMKKPYIATHPDFICPTNENTILVDCGAICDCIKSATGCVPDKVLGKPDPCMLDGILKRNNLEPNQLAMVGDRLYTDIAMAHRTGALGVLVLSGEATVGDLEFCNEPPDLIVENIGELGKMLEKA